jgi:hypothetical protein
MNTGNLKAFLILFIFSASFLTLKAQQTELITSTGTIYGTLKTPIQLQQMTVALIIAGSGPTDRDGNNPAMKNNSLKMLSDSLLSHGIASLCYDKRGIAESVAAGSDESALRFENYIDDAVAWIEKLKSDNRYNKIIVIGHSEGSLIGMIAAARANADGFISMAGAGFKAGDILKTQLAAQPEAIKNACYSAIDSLEAGKTVSEVNPMLYSLFRPSVQPYLISWFKYDPRVEIRKISKPVLILQGTTDIQVSVQDAENLKEALPTATLSIIDGMNHILKDAPADRQANIATYSEPDLPIDKELIKDIVDFIKNLQ